MQVHAPSSMMQAMYSQAVGKGVSVPTGPDVFERNYASLAFDIDPQRAPIYIQDTAPVAIPSIFARGAITIPGGTSPQYLRRAGNLAGCDRFNFANGATSEFSICFWLTLYSLSSYGGIMTKAPFTISLSGGTWDLGLGGAGSRLDFYAFTNNTSSTARADTLLTQGTGFLINTSYFMTLTYSGLRGPTGALQVFRNTTLLTTTQTTMPTLFQNSNVAANEMSIGRRNVTGGVPFNGAISQPLFYDFILTTPQITAMYNSGRGVSLSMSTAGYFSGYDFTEPTSTPREDRGTAGNTLVDDIAPGVERRLAIVDYTSKDPFATTGTATHFYGGKSGPPSAPVYSRSRQPRLMLDEGGVGKHAIYVGPGAILYRHSGLNNLANMTTGNYFVCLKFDAANTYNAENFEFIAGDDVTVPGDPNNRALYFGYPASTQSGLTGGKIALAIRPDGVDIGSSPAGWQGIVTNLANNLGGENPAPGTFYPVLGQKYLVERSVIDLTSGTGVSRGGYRIWAQNTEQPIWVNDGGNGAMIPNRWFDDFVITCAMFGGTLPVSGLGFTIYRACCYNPTLSESDRQEIRLAIMADCGL